VAALLHQTKPELLHFSMHCNEYGDLLLEDEKRRPNPVKPQTVRDILKPFAGVVRCCLLNACFSEVLARSVAEHVDCVIGMTRGLRNDAAIAFAAGFYQALGFGRPVKTAFDLGRCEIAVHGIPGDELPRLCTGAGADPARLYLSGRPELRAEFARGDDDKLRCPHDAYSFRVFIHDAPPDTHSVVYQLNYSASHKEFEPVEDDGSRTFGLRFGACGNFEIRATLWYADRGEGLKCPLVTALERTYGPAPKGPIGKALKALREN
jgi:hypothetical protein